MCFCRSDQWSQLLWWLGCLEPEPDAQDSQYWLQLDPIRTDWFLTVSLRSDRVSILIESWASKCCFVKRQTVEHWIVLNFSFKNFLPDLRCSLAKPIDYSLIHDVVHQFSMKNFISIKNKIELRNGCVWFGHLGPLKRLWWLDWPVSRAALNTG